MIKGRALSRLSEHGPAWQLMLVVAAHVNRLEREAERLERNAGPNGSPRARWLRAQIEPVVKAVVEVDRAQLEALTREGR